MFQLWMVALLVLIHSMRKARVVSYGRFIKGHSIGGMRNNAGRNTEKIIDKEFYFIDNIPPDERIIALTKKYVCYFDRFTASLPHGIASVLAFKRCQQFIDNFYTTNPSNDNKRRIILDSGCGKGSSTLELAKRYPKYPVIGIERSHMRLSYNKFYEPIKEQFHNQTISRSIRNEPQGCESDGDDFMMKDEEKRISDFQNVPNALLLRAELSSFWHLLIRETDWIVYKHFLLHPNPSPKYSLIKLRFPGSPSLPFFPLLGGSLIVRSNWKTYCEEFHLGLQTIQSLVPNLVSQQILDQSELEKLVNPEVYSHFDRKYVEVGVPIYQLDIPFPERSRLERLQLKAAMQKISYE